MRSLLAPLVLGLVLSLAATFTVQWSAVRITTDRVMEDYIAGDLAQDADELYSALAIMPGGDATLAITHFDPAFLTPSSGRYYQVLVDENLALRSPSLVYAALPVRPVDRGARRLSRIGGPNDQSLLLSTSGYDLKGRRVTIGVAADIKPVQDEFDTLLTRYAEVSAGMFAVLVLLQVVIVRLALAPLRRVQDDVRRLEHGETDKLRESVPAEVLPLVREVNRLLALLTQRLQRSRQALGNLAHALKAPLTVLTQIANDDYVRMHPTLGGQLRQQLDALRDRIDSELRRARVAGAGAPVTALDVAAEINALVSTVRKLYRDRDLTIACGVDPAARFRGDREDFLELCGNLVDNACKWARSRVAISLRGRDPLVLTVEDDGPGCSPHDLDRLARRGVRLDETVEGHGLGLAIVRSIASAYGAQMHFGRSTELGGFRVVVTFPGS